MHRLDGTGSAKQAQAESVRWEAVKTVADVERLKTSSSGPVLLDLYADWCISCKVMERSVFPEPEVARQLARFTLLRADVTANDAQDKALLKQMDSTPVWFFSPKMAVRSTNLECRERSRQIG